MVLLQGDCLQLMPLIADNSVDMVLCDLPYGTTQNKWDSVIPLAPLWAGYRRVIKPAGAIVLTAAQPFTSALVCSAIDLFKYTWVWEKNAATGFLNAKKQPMRAHEDVVVFYKNPPTYNPKMTKGVFKSTTRSGVNNSTNYGAQSGSTYEGDLRYPRSVQKFNIERGLHPTQKPVALMEYLIKTYTNEGDTVLDNCMGSGTTGVACVNTGRKFIGIEQNTEYFNIARERINNIG